MSDDDDNVTPIQRKRPVRPRGAGKPPPRPQIAVRPGKEIPDERVDLSDLDLGQRLNRREIACVNLRLAGAPFHEIARLLEYPDVPAAKRDFTRALAATHDPEDWDTLRHIETVRAEALFRESFAMASATHLVDLDDPGKKLPNTERLRWHEQASRDLMNHAIISGAKAPAKLEVTPGEADYDQMVSALLRAQGHQEIEEADVVQIFETPESDHG